jgi:hypothetical protein
MSTAKTNDDGYLSSEALIVELAREAQQTQIGAMESLDTKAANLIAFAGILVGLIFSSNLVRTHWTWPLAVGTGFLFLSTVPLVFGVLWQSFNFDPNIASLDDLFAGADHEDTLHAVRDSLRTAVDQNAEALKGRTRAVRCGALIIVIALALVVGSLIYSQEAKTNAPSPKTHPRFVSR